MNISFLPNPLVSPSPLNFPPSAVAQLPSPVPLDLSPSRGDISDDENSTPSPSRSRSRSPFVTSSRSRSRSRSRSPSPSSIAERNFERIPQHRRPLIDRTKLPPIARELAECSVITIAELSRIFDYIETNREAIRAPFQGRVQPHYIEQSETLPYPILVGPRQIVIRLPEELGEGSLRVVRLAYDLIGRERLACVSSQDYLTEDELEESDAGLWKEIKVRNYLEESDCRLANVKFVAIDRNSYFHLVMSQYNGDLHERVFVRHPQLETTEIESIMKKLIKSVAALHANDVVHRDIKLQNILYSFPVLRRTSPNPYLSSLDQAFICKSNDAIEQMPSEQRSDYLQCRKTLAGTAAYLSPNVISWARSCSDIPNEQWKANDVWALGLALFQLVTRRDPHIVTIFDAKRDAGFSASQALLTIVNAALAGSPQHQQDIDSIDNTPIAPVLKNVLKSMLQLKAVNRITMQQAVNQLDQ